jgi:hypothetical protein
MGFALVVACIFGVFTLRFFIPNWTLIILLITASAGGYYQFSYKPAQEAAQTIQGN